MSTVPQVHEFMEGVRARNPHEPEFCQAVEEVVASVMPLYLETERYRKAKVLDRLSEPDRVLSFRVTWEDDAGEVHTNRGWRVQFNNMLGPYKGGLRFHPSVNQSVLKFLGFEQIFKNSLTGLPMGGAKGGSNFDPKGKSDREVMRFCQSLMTQMHRHIGEDVDVPAGDIGVGGREISYLFGQYVRLENRWAGVMTGKGGSYGGSAVRTEATGYGCVYFAGYMLEQHGKSMEGANVAISGSGNVALYAAEKTMEFGGRVVTLSDSKGFVHIGGGLTKEQLEFVKDLKENRRGRISEFAEKFDGVEFHEGQRPWSAKCEIAMPCATQNELELDDAKTLVSNGCHAIAEGANMPTTAEAADYFREKGALLAPGKAANAGGVAVSGLEQSQNAMRLSWSHKEVDERLKGIMKDIHDRCVRHAERNGRVDYVDGANLAGFEKVAEAMTSYGVV